jgi:hypothetical protein
MRRAIRVSAAGILAVLLSGCGTNNIEGSFFTPTAAVPSLATATPGTKSPTPAATAVPPTATATRNATPTVTQTSVPTAAATPVAATVLFSADPMDAANPFPSDRLLDASGHAVAPPVTRRGVGRFRRGEMD